MKICDFLDPAHLVVDITEPTRRGVFRQILAKVRDHLPAGIQPEELADRLEEEEVLQASCVDSLIAVPHLRVPGLDCTLVAVGKTLDPFVYDAASQLRINLIFLVLSPEEETGRQLRLLARLSRICHEGEFARRALSVHDSDALYTLIEEEDWRHI